MQVYISYFTVTVLYCTNYITSHLCDQVLYNLNLLSDQSSHLNIQY